MTKCVHAGWGILDRMKKGICEKIENEKWRFYGNGHFVGRKQMKRWWMELLRGDMLWARVDRLWQIQFTAKSCAALSINSGRRKTTLACCLHCIRRWQRSRNMLWWYVWVLKIDYCGMLAFTVEFYQCRWMERGNLLMSQRKQLVKVKMINWWWVLVLAMFAKL